MTFSLQRLAQQQLSMCLEAGIFGLEFLWVESACVHHITYVSCCDEQFYYAEKNDKTALHGDTCMRCWRQWRSFVDDSDESTDYFGALIIPMASYP